MQNKLGQRTWPSRTPQEKTTDHYRDHQREPWSQGTLHHCLNARLARMFSKEAADRLSEIFGTLFKSEINKDRKDPLVPRKNETNSATEGQRTPPGEVKKDQT